MQLISNNNPNLKLNTHKFQNLKQQTGTSLIEVLVAIIITAIGLLGLAALQNTSLKLSYDSYLRSQANFLAYDLIDRVRTNPDEEAGYDFDNTSTMPSLVDCFVGNTCSTDDIRRFDIYHWRTKAIELLPDANFKLSYDTSQQIYSMKISWQDRIINDVEDDGSTVETKEFNYHFKVKN